MLDWFRCRGGAVPCAPVGLARAPAADTAVRPAAPAAMVLARNAFPARLVQVSRRGRTVRTGGVGPRTRCRHGGQTGRARGDGAGQDSTPRGTGTGLAKIERMGM